MTVESEITRPRGFTLFRRSGLAQHDSAHPRHPKESRARILLSSVFGPFAQDDEHGSRSINPMELYHNQVTRVQGATSLRMFHRSFGLMMIQANVDTPCTLLDFPTLDRFVEEVRDGGYDVVGVSSIIPNIGKVQKMCEVIREHSPRTTIVVGGHVSNKPDVDELVQLGFLLIKKRRWHKALDAMETAADIAREDPRPWFYIAVLKGDHLHRLDDALVALLQYESLGGNEPAALQWLEELKASRSGK